MGEISSFVLDVQNLRDFLCYSMTIVLEVHVVARVTRVKLMLLWMLTILGPFWAQSTLCTLWRCIMVSACCMPMIIYCVNWKIV